MRSLISGATGFIGRAVARAAGDAVALGRDPARVQATLGAVEVHAWDALRGPPPAEAFTDVDVVVHLLGEPVVGRWTAARKRLIEESRVLGTKHLVAAMAELPRRPRVLVSASAVGYYGERGDEELDERSSPGHGFLAELCVEWERAALAARGLGVRVVCARMGIVLGREGGALGKMLPSFRLGAGGRIGSGRQWMSWIHLEDVVGLLLHAATRSEIEGPFNVVGPQPVRNQDFTRALATALRRPALFAVPKLALKALYGEGASTIWASQRVLPRAALEAGYTFKHPELAPALATLVR